MGSQQSQQVPQTPFTEIDASAQGRESNPPHHALIVDDDVDFCVLMREMLKWRGFDASVAYNASDALSSMGEDPPEIILVDIQMPEVDGLELIRKIRSDESFANTPIIVITAAAFRHTLLASQEAGANFYLTKPVSYFELDHTISGIM